MTDAIQSTSLVKVYRRSQTTALRRVTITVRNGQIFTLFGRNGAGKTTFLRTAATQLLPTDGRVEVLGSDVVSHPKQIRERVSVVPQEGSTYGPLTPWDHVYLSLLARGTSRAAAKDRAQKVLDELELKEYRKKPADTLSGGLRQRVRIAMAVAADADLLFLDEPTLGLDAISRRRIWSILKDISKEGRTILLTTHYIEEAEILSDNVAVINTGSLLTSGSPRELLGKIPERVRVDVTGQKFSEEELVTYGRPVRIAERWRVLTDNQRSGELTVEAVKRGCEVSVAPVSLEDLFVDVVGGEEDDPVVGEAGR